MDDNVEYKLTLGSQDVDRLADRLRLAEIIMRIVDDEAACAQP